MNNRITTGKFMRYMATKYYAKEHLSLHLMAALVCGERDSQAMIIAALERTIMKLGQQIKELQDA